MSGPPNDAPSGLELAWAYGRAAHEHRQLHKEKSDPSPIGMSATSLLYAILYAPPCSQWDGPGIRRVLELEGLQRKTFAAAVDLTGWKPETTLAPLKAAPLSDGMRAVMLHCADERPDEPPGALRITRAILMADRTQLTRQYLREAGCDPGRALRAIDSGGREKGTDRALTTESSLPPSTHTDREAVRRFVSLHVSWVFKRLDAALDSGARVVEIVGPLGVGKSAVANHWSEDLSRNRDISTLWIRWSSPEGWPIATIRSSRVVFVDDSQSYPQAAIDELVDIMRREAATPTMFVVIGSAPIVQRSRSALATISSLRGYEAIALPLPDADGRRALLTRALQTTPSDEVVAALEGTTPRELLALLGSEIDLVGDVHPGLVTATVEAIRSATLDQVKEPKQDPPDATRAVTGRIQAVDASLSDTDQLGRSGLVAALAALVTDKGQGTPLTVAILGDWGSGKSNLMQLLRNELKSRYVDFADFNAWEYELTGNMAAGLAQEVVAGVLEGTRLGRLPKALSPEFWWLWLRFVFLRHTAPILALFAVFVVLGWLVTEAPDLLTYLMTDATAADSKEWAPYFRLTALGLGLVVLVGGLRALKEALAHPFAVGLKTYLVLPRYQGHLGLTPVIKGDLQLLTRLRLGGKKPRRLLVFVDDLDRCADGCISETLDAIRLVMDLEHVIVLIGMDASIALRAMSQQYKEYGDKKNTPREIARQFLGKIIQIPIRLAPPQPSDLVAFVDNRLFPEAKAGATLRDLAHNHRLIDWSPEEPAPAKTVALGRDLPSPAQRLSDMEPVETPPRVVEPDPSPSVPPEPLQRPDLAKLMRHGQDESAWFFHLANAFGVTNPRQLTRLRNSYSLLKLLDAFRTSGRPDLMPFDRLCLMRMLFFQDVINGLELVCRDRVAAAVRSGNVDPTLSADMVANVRRWQAVMRSLPEVPAPGRRPAAGALDPDFDELSDFACRAVLPSGDPYDDDDDPSVGQSPAENQV